MKEHVKDKWVKALRSGKYKQGKNTLHEVNGQPSFCCLGVLCDLYQKLQKRAKKRIAKVSQHGRHISYDDHVNYLPESVQQWAGMKNNRGFVPGGKSLDARNDDGVQFPAIADIIDEHWKEL